MGNEKISKFDVPSYIQGSSQIKAFFEGQAQAFKFLAQSLETGQMVTPQDCGSWRYKPVR